MRAQKRPSYPGSPFAVRARGPSAAGSGAADARAAAVEDIDGLGRLLDKLYRDRGLDFRDYRPTTMSRRVTRRLRARNVESYEAYARVLDQDPAEYAKLLDDLTINVTEFFRDAEAVKALEDFVLPALIQRGAASQRRLRIWSAGCAIGAEPYSIAMLLRELLAPDADRWDVTILATDIDAAALERAEAAVYDDKALANVDAVRRDKHFEAVDGGLRVRPEVGRWVRFARHDFVGDPPYPDIDLVVCRNVMIYFTESLQLRALTSFHEAVREDGYLLLGKSEAVRIEMVRRFACIDVKARLYRRIGAGGEQTQPRRAAPVAAQAARGGGKLVVIGASAGGIEALTAVVSRLPADLAAAVLIVQHLSPDRRTGLADYLDRLSPLKVCMADDGMPIKAGRVYIAVPGRHLRVEHGHLVVEMGERVNYVRPAADVLFASAANCYGADVIGVILSGTGRDGANGCEAIKANGGVTIAQDAESARCFAMSRAAIDKGAVDDVLAVNEIAGKIAALVGPHKIKENVI